jgi:hypothetical protein
MQDLLRPTPKGRMAALPLHFTGRSQTQDGPGPRGQETDLRSDPLLVVSVWKGRSMVGTLAAIFGGNVSGIILLSE